MDRSTSRRSIARGIELYFLSEDGEFGFISEVAVEFS